MYLTNSSNLGLTFGERNTETETQIEKDIHANNEKIRQAIANEKMRVLETKILYE